MRLMPGLTRAVGFAAASTLALALLVCGCVFGAMAGPAIRILHCLRAKPVSCSMIANIDTGGEASFAPSPSSRSIVVPRDSTSIVNHILDKAFGAYP